MCSHPWSLSETTSFQVDTCVKKNSDGLEREKGTLRASELQGTCKGAGRPTRPCCLRPSPRTSARANLDARTTCAWLPRNPRIPAADTRRRYSRHRRQCRRPQVHHSPQVHRSPQIRTSGNACMDHPSRHLQLFRETQQTSWGPLRRPYMHYKKNKQQPHCGTCKCSRSSRTKKQSLRT